MLTVSVDTTSVTARLDAMPDKVHAELLKEITSKSLDLRNYIINDKLSGQVLNFHTHKLQQSIFQEVNDGPSQVIGVVKQENAIAPYGAIHEYGGQTAPHDILPNKAEALHFMMNGKEVFAKVVHHPGSRIPERSYMRSSLADKSNEIINGIKAAVTRGLNE